MTQQSKILTNNLSRPRLALNRTPSTFGVITAREIREKIAQIKRGTNAVALVKKAKSLQNAPTHASLAAPSLLV